MMDYGVTGLKDLLALKFALVCTIIMGCSNIVGEVSDLLGSQYLDYYQVQSQLVSILHDLDIGKGPRWVGFQFDHYPEHGSKTPTVNDISQYTNI